MARISGARLNAVRAVERACAAGLDSRALRTAVMARLRPVVPADAYCFGTLDPTTLLVTDDVSEGLPAEAGPLAAHNEYRVPDVDKFADLARAADPVGILSRSTGGDPASSHRFRTVLPLIGARHELRAAFVADGRCWGAVAMFRTGERPDFSAADADLLRAVSRPVALALRRAAGDTADPRTPHADTGVLVLDDRGATLMSNDAARAWLAAGIRGLGVAEVASAARAGRDARARLRVRSRGGAWVSLRASPMTAGDGAVPAGEPVVVVIERAAAPDVAEMLALSHGLSPREREVAARVADGLPYARIAAELHITVDTVQDHLKSIFAKLGVRGRAALVAHLNRA
ncbi:helix-turn-helix transcriptional regulator [Virgisporangium aliadipatigenens]|uniref:Helix-turn-helix transcriptional regulator n=1 Tax=Virgisporangium aliadipatigenens TaxID=741659 RepID=A0A8J3YES5_9ACTN|nr:LuxR C-terminal-related transcriptional regulator [Virgisporangium aliadipatigenens]GIJ43814.1 helix-turn-helix transcriptional regulator [Virgisporangium aliadipatigenens]